jgi:hypothetical protein
MCRLLAIRRPVRAGVVSIGSKGADSDRELEAKSNRHKLHAQLQAHGPVLHHERYEITALTDMFEGFAHEPEHGRPQPHEQRSSLCIAPFFLIDGLGSYPVSDA